MTDAQTTESPASLESLDMINDGYTQGLDQYVENEEAIPLLTDSELSEFFTDSPDEPIEPQVQEPEGDKAPDQITPPAQTPDLNTPPTPEDAQKAQQMTEAQLRERLEQQRQFVERKRSEIASLRQRLEEQSRQLQDKIPDLQVENPDAWLDAKGVLKDNLAEINALQRQDQILEQRYQTQVSIETHLKPEEFDVTAMAETLARDGVDAEYINAFRQDPLAILQGDTAIHLAKRAVAEKAVLGIYSAYRTMEKERDELKAKLEQRGPDMVKKFAQASNARQTITAQNGAANTSASPEIDPTKLSDAELKEFLKKAGSNI